jgi:hypothetical protein
MTHTLTHHMATYEVTHILFYFEWGEETKSDGKRPSFFQKWDDKSDGGLICLRAPNLVGGG